VKAPSRRFGRIDGPQERRLHLTAPALAYPPGIAEYVVTAELVDHPGVSRQLALPGDETLDDLHQLLRGAFEWHDDHLYSYWLNGEFWSGRESEYTSPIEAEPGAKTADVALDELGLEPGQVIAYLFDFGDQWRVQLRVDEIRPEHGTKGRVLRSTGEAPPQYAPIEES
jgi:hypothetical protein